MPLLKKSFFIRPKIELEGGARKISCPGCGAKFTNEVLQSSLWVCLKCGHHMMIAARLRIKIMTDEGSFVEHDSGLTSSNPLEFPEYDDKLKTAMSKSKENEAVITGTAKIGGYTCAIFAMESQFMMGSMGTVTGEKITRLFEHATEHNLPVIGCTVSGGARMQEGILSLMQMAKTSGAVSRHSDAGNLYIALLTNPTTGGVVASFAMQADIILAEPKALVGFAGPRVIEQTIRQKLPSGFQRSEFLLEKGFVDRITDRRTLKQELTTLLIFHREVTP